MSNPFIFETQPTQPFTPPFFAGENEYESGSDYNRWIQRSLNQVMGLNLTVDGDIGAKSRNAIRGFQQRSGLAANGVVDSQTERALVAAGAMPPTGSTGPTPDGSGPDDATACGPFTLAPVENPGGGRIKDKRIPDSSDIVVIQGAFAKTPLHRLAAEARKALVCAARADGIKPPRLLLPTGILSGFRSPKLQASLRRSSEATHGSQNLGTWVAKPGSSAHQSGRAIDFYLGIPNDRRNVTRLRQTSAYKWMAANAQRFGFYPYPAEPWHWEYNPPARGPSETGEALFYEDAFAHESEYETGRKCKRDWCSPAYIQWVQQSLNRLRKTGAKLREDGFHDDATRKATVSFQKQFGLKPDGVVGPVTENTLVSQGAGQPPQVKELPCLPAKAETLIAKLNQHRGDIPLHILLGWIEVESGRQNGVITSLCERGYFQIYPGEAKDRGITNHQLLSYDEDHAIQSGVKLVNYFIARTNLLVRKYGLPNQGEAYWKMVKMHHWIPSGPEKILVDMQARGVQPSDWAVITGYALDPQNRDRLRQKIKRDPQQGIGNADKMLEEANKWLKKLQANQSLNKEAEYESFEINQEASPPPLLVSGGPDYNRWIQGSLNRVLGLNLTVDGDIGAKSRSAIRGFQQRSGLAANGVVDSQTERALVAAGAMPPPSGREKASHGETLYLNIGLGMGKSLASTGIYVPHSFRPDSGLTVVVYLHGHKGMYPGNAALINSYWDGARFPFFALREEVAASGQNVVFVAPSLGPTSQAGSLVQKGGFDAFMQQVLAGFNEHYLMPRHGRRIDDAQSVILAAHSGGGSPMLQIARGTDRNAAKVTECWCFDSMYRQVAPYWVDWAKARPQQRRLYVYSGPAKGGGQRFLPRDNAEAIARQARQLRLANVCVQPSRARDKGKASAHFWVMIEHLKERLLNSACGK